MVHSSICEKCVVHTCSDLLYWLFMCLSQGIWINCRVNFGTLYVVFRGLASWLIRITWLYRIIYWISIQNWSWWIKLFVSTIIFIKNLRSLFLITGVEISRSESIFEHMKFLIVENSFFYNIINTAYNNYSEGSYH